MCYRLSIVIVAIGTMLLGATAQAQISLSDAEIRSRIIGKTFLWTDGGTSRYDLSGNYSYTSANGQRAIGNWTVAGNGLCVKYLRNIPVRCFKFSRDAKGLQVTIFNGNVLRLSPISNDALTPSPQALSGTLTECDQTVRYTLSPPAADVPRNISDFSGIWVGKWDGGLCGVVIAQQILTDGTAQLLYMWGNYIGLKAGNSGFAGTVNGNMLSVSGSRTEWGGSEDWEYTMRGPNQLVGRFMASGTTRGAFTRK